MHQASAILPSIREEVSGGTRGDLLGECLSLRPHPELPRRLADLSADEWSHLVDRSLWHGVAPLLHRRLRGEEGVDPVAASRLAAAYGESRDESARAHRELAAIAAAMAGEGITLVALKGAYLAEAVYGDPALRTLGDLDLMVRPHQVERAHAVLLGMGYRSGTAQDMVPVYGANHHLRPMSMPGTMEVELHWSIDATGVPVAGGPRASPFALDMDEVWAAVEPVRIAGAAAGALSVEHLLLHLSLHAVFHHGLNSSIRQFCDIAWTVRRRGGEVDWPLLVETAHRWRAAELVGAALGLAHELLGAALPPQAAALPKPRHPRLAAAMRRHVLLRPPRDSREHAEGRSLINPWLMRLTGMAGRGGH